MKKLTFLLVFLAMSSVYAVKYAPEEVSVGVLNPKEMKDHPMDEMIKWHKEALNNMGSRQANTFVLGTVNTEGKPSTRSMTVKKLNRDGIYFCGNANSAKFIDLRENPNSAITFNYDGTQKQVSMIGKSYRIPRSEEKKVWDARDRKSQITSYASESGQPLKDRIELLNKHEDISQRYLKTVPMPENFAVHKFVPQKVSFWKAGPNNLHHAVVYTNENGKTKKTIVQP